MNPITSRTAGRAARRTVGARRAALGGVAAFALALCAEALADGTLYRWTEADGSLTYSPTPPAEGIAYETVRPDGGTAPGERAAADPAAALGGRDAPVDPGAAPRQAASPEARPEPAAPAPSLGAAATEPPTPPAADRQPAETSADLSDAGPAVIASDDRARHCGDLRKRVVSLERRLATHLTPEEMDTTVVQMARYQQSFERHCE